MLPQMPESGPPIPTPGLSVNDGVLFRACLAKTGSSLTPTSTAAGITVSWKLWGQHLGIPPSLYWRLILALVRLGEYDTVICPDRNDNQRVDV